MDFVSRVDDRVKGLSTSEVAALIAFGTFAIQLLLSFIWPLILVGFISEKESAVTWSVVGRLIHNSYWPTVLRTDATATSGVRRRVSLVSTAVVLGALLIGIASIVTPLGLYEDVTPSSDATPVRFNYAPDSSALGLGTAPRHESKGFSRICYNDDGELDDCPHSYQKLTKRSDNTTTGTNVTSDYDTRIPKNTYDFFQSGIERLGQSVSSLFDIEYRTYRSTKDSTDSSIQSGDDYLIGDYRFITNVLLEDSLTVVEGLLIDTKNGGVGFRNHSVPAEALQYGAQWEEDILFIEPVTECIDTNLTLRFNIPSTSTSTDMVENVVLVDNGGFIDLEREHPEFSDKPGQEDPELAYRAYAGAWFNNGRTMLYLNVTNPNNQTTGKKGFSYVNSEKGKEFRLPVFEGTNRATYEVKSMSVNPYLDALNLPSRDIDNGTIINFDGLTLVPPNPWEITGENFTDLTSACQGALSSDYSSSSSVAGACGLVSGIPQRADGSDSVLVEAGSEWEVNLHFCASASRVVIKTVSFSVNSTSLSGLQVASITEKQYQDDSEYPIWAFEDTKADATSSRPLWGLADSEDAPFSGVSFKKDPQLWLNGVDSDVTHTGSGDPSQNLPGTYFHGMALGTAYAIGFDEQYSGVASLLMYNRWKNLTKTTEGTAKLINLVWTDVAANSVVGTRGQASKGEPAGLGPAYDVGKSENEKRADSDDALVPVHVFNRQVKYKLPYAIPAFIVLGIVLVTLGLSFVALIFRGATPRRIRSFLTRLSAGRVMTATLLPDGGIKGDRPAETVEWLHREGTVSVDISGKTPRVDNGLMGIYERESTELKGAAPGKGVEPVSKMLEGGRGAA